MGPTFRRENSFFRPLSTPPPASPVRWKALLSYAFLVFFSAFFALFMEEATDPFRGFLPLVLEFPPAHSQPRGFVASLGVSTLHSRSASDSPKTMVPNSGDYYVFPPMQGVASWYGYDHIGRQTADGGWFDPEAMTAAHRYLPFGSVVRVTRISTGAAVEVVINDRGPYLKGRLIDLARKPASELGLFDRGLARCRIEVLKYPLGNERRYRIPDGEIPVKKPIPGLKTEFQEARADSGAPIPPPLVAGGS